MKKWSVHVVIILTIMLSSACTGSTPPTTAYKPYKANDKVDLTIATGGTGGIYYPLGTALAGAWKEGVPGVTALPQVTAGSIANVHMLNKAQVDLAIIQGDVASYGYLGQPPFETTKGKPNAYQAVSALYPEAVQFIVRAESPIQSIAELKGKRVAVGTPAAGTELLARQILRLYGIDYTTRKELTALYIPFTEGLSALRDNQVDAVVVVSHLAPGVPLPFSVPVRVLHMGDDQRERALKEHNFLVPAEVPAGTYQGHDRSIKTVGVMSILAVRADLNPDLVYHLTKTLVERQDTVGASYKGSKVRISAGRPGVPIPFHPGAERFYKETGSAG